jgi:hypothetical protein
MRADGYGASGSLVKMPGFSSGANSVLVYFSCADCAVEAEKAVRAAGQPGSSSQFKTRAGEMGSPEERSESGRGIPAPFSECFPVYAVPDPALASSGLPVPPTPSLN